MQTVASHNLIRVLTLAYIKVHVNSNFMTYLLVKQSIPIFRQSEAFIDQT